MRRRRLTNPHRRLICTPTVTLAQGSSGLWEVGDVMDVQIPKGFGSGFNVMTDRGKRPLVLFVYETKEEAEAARGQVAAAIERALLVQPFAPVT